MGREDRRHKLALDESYRYYRTLEANAEQPALFKLTKCLRTLSTALAFADQGQFKLTRQLWKRLQQALFDRLISTFPGEFVILDADFQPVPVAGALPEDGVIQFMPQDCKRADDMAHIEVKRLYPKAHMVITKAWLNGSSQCTPHDFTAISECENGVCMMKPMVCGHEVLGEESRTAKDEAYNRWWELYWQAYCTESKAERELIHKHMTQLESVWGNLYY